MANYSTNEFKSGLKILIDGDPYAIVENEMVKPGKGQAFNRVRVRNLKTGRTIERTWKSGDTVEAADVVDTDMQYLYSDGDFFHFMAPETFEQLTASKEAVGEGAQWLKDGTHYITVSRDRNASPRLLKSRTSCVRIRFPFSVKGGKLLAQAVGRIRPLRRHSMPTGKGSLCRRKRSKLKNFSLSRQN
jgi:translation elongation factor P/translation initiation factor 5A